MHKIISIYSSSIFFVLILVYPLFSFSEELAFNFNDESKIYSIGGQIKILEDKTSSLNILQVINDKNFKESKQDVPSMSISSSSFWLKIKIKNNTSDPNILIKLDYPLANEVKLYSVGSNIDSITMGGDKLFPERKYNHQSYLFDLNIPPGESKLFFIRVKSNVDLLLPLYIGTIQQILEKNSTNDLLNGIYFGLMFVMLLYNLFVFFTVRDKSYLYYVLFIAFVGLTQASFHGYANMYLWPNSPWLISHSVFIIGACSGIFAMLFLKEFLKVKEYFPKYNYGFYFFSFLYLISFILCLNDIFDIAFNVVNLTSMLASFYMLFVGYKVMKKGYKPAKFFLIAQTLFLSGVIIFSLRNFGVLPFNNFTNYIFQIGSGIETILLSFALADRIKILQEEKDRSQIQALEALKENERIINEQNIILDIKVTERTLELENSNDELNNTLQNLKETQSKLVDAEKMASLGQLTAGIAHEINNPINFVSSSVNPLKRDIADILTILNKYDEISKDGNFDQTLKEVNILKKELDLDYLKEEINTLLTGIDDGANRTAEIVRGLRNFSRMDEDDLKMAALHEGIDASLVLLNSTLGGRIEIRKEFGEIPFIECYPGKLNQVFMNILTNAIQAIHSNKEEHGKGMIAIKTFEKDKNVIISIKDTGPGMPEEVKNKIFEPFFTTKEVGEGTGLGLSIVFSIIEAHKGHIAVKSEKGKGTEFIITLPKIQKN